MLNFQGCGINKSCNEDLLKHIYDTHYEVFSDVLEYLVIPRKDVDKDPHKLIGVWSAYQEAIAIKIRAGAPLAHLAIDRRALYNYTSALADEQICSLI